MHVRCTVHFLQQQQVQIGAECSFTPRDDTPLIAPACEKHQFGVGVVDQLNGGREGHITDAVCVDNNFRTSTWQEMLAKESEPTPVR